MPSLFTFGISSLSKPGRTLSTSLMPESYLTFLTLKTTAFAGFHMNWVSVHHIHQWERCRVRSPSANSILVIITIGNQSILKEINPRYSLKGLMLKLKLWYLWPPDVRSWLIVKDPAAGKDWGQEEKGTTEDEMVGWHHRLSWTWV